MKNDTTFFAWFCKVIGKLITIVVCLGSSVAFFATMNSNAPVALATGAVAFLSFCHIFSGE